MPSLTNHIALVTGAGQGIGRAIALELARNGAHVVINNVGGITDQVISVDGGYRV